MNTAQLESFLAVANNLNYSKPCESVHMTQPSVNIQPNSMDDVLGFTLPVRTNRHGARTIA